MIFFIRTILSENKGFLLPIFSCFRYCKYNIAAKQRQSFSNSFNPALIHAPPPHLVSQIATRSANTFRKFRCGCLISSIHKRSEAFLKIHHLRRLRREASAERLTSQLMVSFRSKRTRLRIEDMRHPQRNFSHPLPFRATIPVPQAYPIDVYLPQGI